MPTSKILVLIVLAQFLCTSLWFAGNAVMGDLIEIFDLPGNSLGHLTSSVQLGFITGTLCYAILTIADRFSPSKVFFVSALLGALMNAMVLLPSNTFITILIFRFAAGFFLAGIYPVGMKIASDYYKGGLGKALGYLVGALVLGTALPHFIKSVSFGFYWGYVIIATSALAVLGGLLIFLWVKDGPYHSKSQKIDFTAFFRVFKDKNFRSPAFGYFGHMWELYTFWAFVPVILYRYREIWNVEFDVSLLSFFIIGIGFLSCIVGGYLSMVIGSRKTAFLSLLLSATCCVVSLFMMTFPFVFFIAFLLFWGVVVISDSPQFSTLVASNAPQEFKGTALTIVNCIGFSITILSIELLNSLATHWSIDLLLIILFIGPFLGLIGLGWNDPRPASMKS